jgi:hypothetical protein
MATGCPHSSSNAAVASFNWQLQKQCILQETFSKILQEFWVCLAAWPVPGNSRMDWKWVT